MPNGIEKLSTAERDSFAAQRDTAVQENNPNQNIIIYPVIADKRLKPDTTIFGMRNDTIADARNLLLEVISRDNRLFDIAYVLSRDIGNFFAGDIDSNIKLINKDNVCRVTKHYALLTHGQTLSKDICDEWIFNTTKKQYLTRINDAYKERVKDLGIEANDLNTEFEKALDTAFQGWKAVCFGYIDNSNIQRIDDIFDKYNKRILEKEVELRTGLFNKPFRDEEVEKFLDKNEERGPWIVGYRSVHDLYMKELGNDTILSKGINFTGKIDYPSKQMGGSCVMHASVNSLIQNPKGAYLVNRLLRVINSTYGGTAIVCIPEAVKNNEFYYPMANGEDVERLALTCSFGDGDMAALINTYADYLDNSERNFGEVHLGFEALSGEKAQVYLPDEPIPKGVGITNAKLIERYNRRSYEKLTYAYTLYKNLKNMLDNGNGAIVYTLRTLGYFKNNFGKYIKDLETEEPTDKDVMVSSAHAYSVAKLTDEYAYLQESNNPTYYIKLPKNVFTDRMEEIATWRYD